MNRPYLAFAPSATERSPLSPTPPALRPGGIPIRFSGTPPPSARPHPGRGSAWRQSPIRFSSGSPRGVDRGDIAMGRGREGFPLPAGVNSYVLLRHPHSARPSASSPPLPGRGQSWRYPVGSRVRLIFRISPCSGPWWLSPWGGDRGGVSPSAGGCPCVPPQSPRPPEGGQCVGIPGTSRLPGCKPPVSV